LIQPTAPVQLHGLPWRNSQDLWIGVPRSSSPAVSLTTLTFASVLAVVKPWGCMREGQPGGHGGDLHDTALIAAVPALAGVMGDWDLPPGQGSELSEQGRLVALDREQVMRTAPGQAVSVAALGMQRISGNDRPAILMRSHRTGNIGISFVFAPTCTWPKTAP
jgi:hypothetical protein